MEEDRKIAGFVCQICSKALKSKQSLGHHMNIHTGERPFRCEFEGCGVAYRYASQLSNHRMNHRSISGNVLYGFDDLKIFAEMVIKVFGNEKKEEAKIPGGPYGPNIRLPPILNHQMSSKLPNFKF